MAMEKEHKLPEMLANGNDESIVLCILVFNTRNNKFSTIVASYIIWKYICI